MYYTTALYYQNTPQKKPIKNQQHHFTLACDILQDKGWQTGGKHSPGNDFSLQI